MFRNLEILQKWHDHYDAYFIDAICIDQKNVREKAEQIDNMWQVYSKATHVLGFASQDGITGPSRSRIVYIEKILANQVAHNRKQKEQDRNWFSRLLDRKDKRVRETNMSMLL